jgi:Lon protease-like protein
MERLLPIFPLGLVAFPGMTLPLHVFEERYRALVRDLLAIPDPEARMFGVVAIREGYEVGTFEAKSMYRTGCLMRLDAHQPYPDGRFDISSVGRGRVRVLDTDTDKPYLRAQVALVTNPAEDPGQLAAEAMSTIAVFQEYRATISELRDDEVMTGTLPADPELLSYALAATCALPLVDRQHLLEAAGTADRLGLLRRQMRAELRAMRALPSLPATEVARSGWNPN